MLFRPTPDRDADAFDVFWRTAPRRQGGKLEAEREYRKALQHANVLELQKGMEVYAAYVRAHGYEERYIRTPAEWLKRGCWADEYEMPAERPVYQDCDHDPRCNSKQWCAVLRSRERGEIA